MAARRRNFPKFHLKVFIFVIFLFLSIVPLLISSTINYRRDKKATMESALLSRDQFMSLVTLEMDNIVEQVVKIYMRLSVDQDLLQKLGEKPADSLEELQRVQYVNRNILTPYLALYPYIENFIIYPQTGQHAIVCGSSGFSVTYNYKDFDTYQTAVENHRISHWQGLHDYEGSYYGYTIKNAISFYQAVKSGKNTFVVEIQIKQAALDEKILAGMDSYGSKIILLDAEGKVVSSNQKLTTGQADEIRKDKKNEYLSKSISLNNNWTLLYSIPRAALKENARKQMYTTVGITAVYVSLAAFLSVLTSMLVSWPIQKVVANMEIPLEKDTMDDKFSSNIKEISFLADSFENMRERTKSLIADLLEEQDKKQKAEMKVLQSQINPHFLYNSLNLIRCSAMLNHQKEIEKMSSAIIQLLEFSINSQECVRISDEVNITKQYIALQECRHNKDMNVDIVVQEGISRNVILKMSVIPLVENAIMHAYSGGEDDVRIKVHIYCAEEKLIIEVKDYGSGMTKQRISEVMECSGGERKFNRIGLKNIIERIQLYFGNSYKLTIKSEEGKGTLVKVEHPVLNEKDWEEIRVKYHEKNYDCR